MTDIFDFTRPSLLYAVMGNPVEHSRSPEIHRYFAEEVFNYQGTDTKQFLREISKSIA